MKVSKEYAEQYLNAFEALERASTNIGDRFVELEEFGDIKVGDIYIDLYRKEIYPEHPERWYFLVESIFCAHPGNVREIFEIRVRFFPLDSSENSFTERYVHKLDHFKKIRYLSGKCSLFKDDKCEFVDPQNVRRKQGIFKVIGFLIDEPLILISGDRGILSVYPNEIRGVA